MTRKRWEELAVEYGLGISTPEEATYLEALVAHDADLREDLESFIDTAAAFAAASSPVIEPSPDLRERILADIVTTPQMPTALPEAGPPTGFTFLRHGPEGWQDSGTPGLRQKLLASGPGTDHAIMLLALEPGGRVPEHDHGTTEQLYILSGHLHTEGRVLRPGDFLRAEAGTHHHQLISPDGCVALLIISPALAA
ncbi:MAG: cupin domain-containing protein [Verrucomicrobia bacterium]|nr:cupin domain-containing protein [Verrucomicrobiota bacterium]